MLFPGYLHENLTIETSRTPEMVQAILETAVDARTSSWMPSPSDKPFLGTVNADGFEIYRRLNYRNSWRPIIKGRIASRPTGTVVEMTIGAHGVIRGFMFLWLGGLGLMFVFLLSSWLFSGGQYSGDPLSGLIIIVGMFVFGLALSLGAYNHEASKAKSLLRELLASSENP